MAQMFHQRGVSSNGSDLRPAFAVNGGVEDLGPRGENIGQIIKDANIRPTKQRLPSAVYLPKKSDLRLAYAMTQRPKNQGNQPKIWETTKYYATPQYSGGGVFMSGPSSNQITTPNSPQSRYSCPTFIIDKGQESKARMGSKRQTLYMASSGTRTKITTNVASQNQLGYDIKSSVELTKRMDFNMRKHGVDKLMQQKRNIESLNTISQKHQRGFSGKGRHQKLKQLASSAQNPLNETSIESESIEVAVESQVNVHCSSQTSQQMGNSEALADDLTPGTITVGRDGQIEQRFKNFGHSKVQVRYPDQLEQQRQDQASSPPSPKILGMKRGAGTRVLSADGRAHAFHQKDFATRNTKNVGGYLLSSNSQSIGGSSYVHRSRQRHEVRSSIVDAIKQQKVPQDLLLEFDMRQKFLGSQKGEGITRKRSVVQDFLLHGGHVRSLESRKNLDSQGIQQRYTEFQQNRMELDTYESGKTHGLEKFKLSLGRVSKEDMYTSIEQLLGVEQDETEKAVKQKFQSHLRVPTERLLSLPTHKSKDKPRFEHKLHGFLTELVSNMTCFDKSLKLQLQMNIDYVHQDQELWQNQQMEHLKALQVQGNRVEITEAMLVAPFEKKCDQDLRHMVESIQDIIRKVKVQPEHNPHPAVDSLAQMNSNLKLISADQEQQMEDLLELTEVLQHLIKRQSLNWVLHQRKFTKVKLVRKCSSRSALEQGGQPGVKQSSQSEEALPQASQEKEDSDYYNDYLVNQLLNLSSLYLLSVINKHMEMQKLSQERQMALFKHNIQIMKTESYQRLEKMQLMFDVQVKVKDEQLSAVETKLQYVKEENQKLKETLREKDAILVQMRYSGGDDGLLDLVRKFNHEMQEMENSVKEKESGKEALTKLVKYLDTVKATDLAERQKNLKFSKATRKLVTAKRFIKAAASPEPEQSPLNTENALNEERDTPGLQLISIPEPAKVAPVAIHHQGSSLLQESEQKEPPRPSFCLNCQQNLDSQKSNPPLVDTASRRGTTASFRPQPEQTLRKSTVQPEAASRQSSNKSSPRSKYTKSLTSKDLLRPQPQPSDFLQLQQIVESKDAESLRDNVETQLRPSKDNVQSVNNNERTEFTLENSISKHQSSSKLKTSKEEVELPKRVSVQPNVEYIRPSSSEQSQATFNMLTQTSVGKFHSNQTNTHLVVQTSIKKQRSVKQLPDKQIKQKGNKSPRSKNIKTQGTRDQLTLETKQTQVLTVEVNQQQRTASNQISFEANVYANKQEIDQTTGQPYPQDRTIALPEITILRLMDSAIEKMLKQEVRALDKEQLIYDFEGLPSFRGFFLEFLLTQYGFPQIANGYFNITLSKLRSRAVIKDNHFANILFSLLNDKEVRVNQNFSLHEWTREQQRVAVYSIVLFDDAAGNSFFAPNQHASAHRNAQQVRPSPVLNTLQNGGHYVSIFDLSDLITKMKMNDLSFRIHEALPPHSLFQESSNLDSDKLEASYLQLAKMRLTDKCVKMNFDIDKFLDQLSRAEDSETKGTITLESFFVEVAKVHKIFFSIEEQVAVRNCLFPSYANEDFVLSGTRQLVLKDTGTLAKGDKRSPCVESQLLLSESEYIANLGACMISKGEFVILVEQQWLAYVAELQLRVTESFLQLDSLHQRGGLNENQFLFLLEQELNFNFTLSFGSMFEKPSFFSKMVDRYESQSSLLSLATIKAIILEHNLEIFPFARYFHCFRFYRKRPEKRPEAALSPAGRKDKAIYDQLLDLSELMQY